MTISLPTGLREKYFEACDFFLDSNIIGRSCTIVYPPKRTSCSNCIVKMVGSTVTNVYRHGGPAYFDFGNCPLCGGNGYSETEVTDTINLRIYWNRAEWIKIIGSVIVPDANVFIIGYMTDLPKVRKAVEILLVKDQNEAEYRTVLTGQPFPWGLFKTRYFAAFLKGA